ncbi:MAG: hypothetical protein LUG16_05100 [Candidatus Gastranaerophilales bacterium]|nr:hypothetical protein [Candidatus Gastranaerophilales bacterium]
MQNQENCIKKENHYWVERDYSLEKYGNEELQQINIVDDFSNYMIIFESSEHYIYLFSIAVKLSPQEYKFLLEIVKSNGKEIEAGYLMNLIQAKNNSKNFTMTEYSRRIVNKIKNEVLIAFHNRKHEDEEQRKILAKIEELKKMKKKMKNKRKNKKITERITKLYIKLKKFKRRTVGIYKGSPTFSIGKTDELNLPILPTFPKNPKPIKDCKLNKTCKNCKENKNCEGNPVKQVNYELKLWKSSNKKAFTIEYFFDRLIEANKHECKKDECCLKQKKEKCSRKHHSKIYYHSKKENNLEECLYETCPMIKKCKESCSEHNCCKKVYYRSLWPFSEIKKSSFDITYT